MSIILDCISHYILSFCLVCTFTTEPGSSQSFDNKKSSSSGEEEAIGISGTNLRSGQSSDGPPPTAFVGSTSGGGSGKKNSMKEMGLIAGISLSLVALVIVIVLVVVIYLRRWGKKNEINLGFGVILITLSLPRHKSLPHPSLYLSSLCIYVTFPFSLKLNL